VDEHHRVALPRLARLLVSNPAPQIDDPLSLIVGAACAAQLMPVLEVPNERSANRFETLADESMDGDLRWCRYEHGCLLPPCSVLRGGSRCRLDHRCHRRELEWLVDESKCASRVRFFGHILGPVRGHQDDPYPRRQIEEACEEGQVVGVWQSEVQYDDVKS